MLPGAELLIDPPFISRAADWMARLRKANPDAHATKTYRGKHELLVLYGVGLHSRSKARKEHLRAGGRVAMWDLGYWDRGRSMRLSIDRLHPTLGQLRACVDRPDRPRPVLAEEGAYDPDGPILLCGLGPKSCVHLGYQPYEWERGAVTALRMAFPGRAILWRPKPGNKAPKLSGTTPAATGPIEEAIRGCSLVVCRHSNVAIDACIAGVPVECQDGAAFALYGAGSNPSPDARRRFLGTLAWWNWTIDEAPGAWKFMEEMTCD